MKKKPLLLFAILTVCAFLSNQLSAQDWHLAGNADATGASKLGTTNSTPVRLFTNNTERMRLDVGGKIGIGTISPTGKLTIQNNGGAPAGSWVTAASPLLVGLGETSGGNGDFILGMAANTGSTRPVMMGRRGRGTLTSPTAVKQNDFIFSILSSGYDGSAFQNPATIDFYVDGNPTAGNVPARISMVTGSNISNRQERLVIGNKGDITVNKNQLFISNETGFAGFGTTLPLKKVHVENGDVRLQSTDSKAHYLEFVKQGTPNDWRFEHSYSGNILYLSYSTDDFASFIDKAYFTPDATGSGGYSFTHLGDAIGYKWDILSDARLKNKIADVPNATSIILKLKPKSYFFNQEKYPQMNFPTEKQFGLLAQDLEKVLPELVTTSMIPTKNEGKERQMEEIKSINYIEIIPFLIKGMQEQQQQIEELKEEIKKISAKQLPFGNVSDNTVFLSDVTLAQNVPNPFTENTTIPYNIPRGFNTAALIISDQAGRTIKQIMLSKTGKGIIKINATELRAGTFSYSIVVDGKTVDSKKMIVVK